MSHNQDHTEDKRDPGQDDVQLEISRKFSLIKAVMSNLDVVAGTREPGEAISHSLFSKDGTLRSFNIQCPNCVVKYLEEGEELPCEDDIQMTFDWESHKLSCNMCEEEYSLTETLDAVYSVIEEAFRCVNDTAEFLCCLEKTVESYGAVVKEAEDTEI